eukprot:31300-Pelagococcus_subviridis.AAC.3
MNRAAPLPAFPTNEVAVAEAKRRLSVAKRLDKLVHSRSKERAEAEWRRVNAAEIGVELDSDEDDDAAVMTFDAAGKIAKVKAKERARRIARGEDGDEVNAADDDDSESDGMNDLRVAGMDVDDQTSHAKFGERLRADREEARLRRELESMLETSLGTNAARRQGIGSAKYPSRGDGGAKLAAAAAAKSEKRARGGGGGDDDVVGGDGSEGVTAVRMLKGGKHSAAAARGAAPGGAAGKHKKKKPRLVVVGNGKHSAFDAAPLASYNITSSTATRVASTPCVAHHPRRGSSPLASNTCSAAATLAAVGYVASRRCRKTPIKRALLPTRSARDKCARTVLGSFLDQLCEDFRTRLKIRPPACFPTARLRWTSLVSVAASKTPRRSERRSVASSTCPARAACARASSRAAASSSSSEEDDDGASSASAPRHRFVARSRERSSGVALARLRDACTRARSTSESGDGAAFATAWRSMLRRLSDICARAAWRRRAAGSGGRPFVVPIFLGGKAGKVSFWDSVWEKKCFLLTPPSSSAGSPGPPGRARRRRRRAARRPDPAARRAGAQNGKNRSSPSP